VSARQRSAGSAPAREIPTSCCGRTCSRGGCSAVQMHRRPSRLWAVREPRFSHPSLPMQAQLLAGFLEIRGWDDATNVGHEIGGELAQLLALREQQRIRRGPARLFACRPGAQGSGRPNARGGKSLDSHSHPIGLRIPFPSVEYAHRLNAATPHCALLQRRSPSPRTSARRLGSRRFY
jgi:hypothetical protein